MKWHKTRGLSRRAFLGGAGAMVALPFLESLWPIQVGRSVPPGPSAGFGLNKRTLFFYIPNGIHMASWTPEIAGTKYEMPLILSPLAPYKDDMLVLSGISNMPAHPDGPGDHAAGTGSFLTAAHCYKTEGDDIYNGISIDQEIANAVGKDYTFPSLEIGIDGGASVGGCDSGYSCAYSRNISWAGPQTPVPKVVNPQLLFERLFGGYDPQASEEEKAKRKKYRLSVLDYVINDAESLEKMLGQSDRHKLDEYLTGVRELELRVGNDDAGPVCEAPGYPGLEMDVSTKVEAMLEMALIAMQCDLTPLTTFMLGNAGSNRSYSFLGVTGGHHDISHHQSNPENFAKLEIINQWEVEQLAYLIKRMKEIPEGEGTLLDNSLVFFSSEIADGNAHQHRNLPILLLGHGGGSVSSGRHVMYEGEPPIADLFISIADSMGVTLETFGEDGTGKLKNLKV